MEAATVHQLHAGDFPWPDDTGELVSVETATDRIRGMIFELEGLVKLTRKQAKENAQLTRRIQQDEDPHSHPRGADIVKLIERWKRGACHTQAKVSADRVTVVKARIKDGYEIASEEWLPDHVTLELAVDGICAFPFVVTGRRVREGTPAQRHDRLGIALAGGEKVEEMARLGYRARKEGLVTWHEEESA